MQLLHHSSIPFLSAAILLLLSSVQAFTFNVSTPTQCADLTVTWEGGSEPYFLVLVPTITVNSGRIYNVSIPTGSNGQYTFTLNEPAGLEFIATMYDSTGWGSGGTTPTLSVGSSTDTSCLDTNLLYDFYFSTSPTSNPSQCSAMTVTWANNVTYPVHLYGLIPGGTAFNIPISQASSDVDVDWNVDIASGTDFLLLMSDAGQYQTGGSTGLLTVQSGSTSCMNSSSPASATSSATSSRTSTGTSTASVSGVGGSSSGGSSGDKSNTSGGSSSSSHTGAIVGGTLGGVAFLVLLGLLLICCIRRRARSRRDSATDPAIRSYGVETGMRENKRRGPFDILAGRGHQRSDDAGSPSGDESPAGAQRLEVDGAAYEPSPFRYPSPPETPGGAVGGGMPGRGAGTGAAVGGAAILAATNDKLARDSQPNSPVAPMHQPDSVRNSADTSRTTSGITPNTPNTRHSQVAPSAYPSALGTTGHTDPDDAGRTDVATVGHHNSIRKSGSAGQLAPPLPLGEGARPLPEVPQRAAEPRFVQHEDAGEVVDLPPRYDQLRARNPDQAI